MQLERGAIVLTGGQGTDGHGRSTGGDQHRNFTRLDPATHLVDGRFQRTLDEGLQKSPSPGRNRIILDEVTLQTHRTNPRTGEGSGIATVRENQFGGAATDVQQEMGAVAPMDIGAVKDGKGKGGER